jgi:hypothetical protein
MCALAHEEVHVNQPCVCKSGAGLPLGVGVCFGRADSQQSDECQAVAAEIQCIWNNRTAVCGDDPACWNASEQLICGTVRSNCRRLGGDICAYMNPCPICDP